MSGQQLNHSAHRAIYTLEMGMWHATCRECGHRVADPNRRRLAMIFREHIKETNRVTAAPRDIPDAI